MSDEHLRTLIDERQYAEAMALQADIQGVKPDADVRTLGMRTARELPSDDPRSHAYAFDDKNPGLMHVRETLAGERSFGSYAELSQSAQDLDNPNRGQARASLSTLRGDAEKLFMAQFVPKVGTAELHLRQAPGAGAVVDVSTYLPDGDVAYGRASHAMLEGLTGMGYRPVVVDDLGRLDSATSPDQLLRYVEEVMNSQPQQPPGPMPGTFPTTA